MNTWICSWRTRNYVKVCPCFISWHSFNVHLQLIPYNSVDVRTATCVCLQKISFWPVKLKLLFSQSTILPFKNEIATHIVQCSPLPSLILEICYATDRKHPLCWNRIKRNGISYALETQTSSYRDGLEAWKFDVTKLTPDCWTVFMDINTLCNNVHALQHNHLKSPKLAPMLDGSAILALLFIHAS